jgi:hypothetical protein
LTQNYQDNEKLIKAWQMASKDLGIQIETPFLINSDTGEIKYDLLIRNFGSELGTLIITTERMLGFEIAEKFGFYCSALNPFHYEHYERENFIETLTDWGYYGQKENKPEWYEGHIYSKD